MEYEGYASVVCDAEESDWLDVSYTERKYVAKPVKKRFSFANIKLSKGWKYAIIAVLCLAVLATMLLVDGGFKKDVFNAVKTASASVFDKQEYSTQNKINIPCNLTLVDVNDGVMTFSGGKATLSLTAGRVSDVSDGTVTIAVDDSTAIVYSGLITLFVNVGDIVSANSLLGKYDGQFTASILSNGETVKQVVGSESQLTWQV